MAYVSVEERRRQLVDAAVRVIERDGVRGLTTRRIAEEAGAPLASIHYAFGTKDDLLEAAVRELVDRMTVPMLRAVDVQAGVAAALRSMIDAFWPSVRDDPQQERLFAELFVTSSDERMKRFARAEYERYRATACSLLGQAAEAAGEKTAVPLEQLARLLVLCFDGVVMQYSLDGDATRAEEDLAAVADALVHLAAPSPAGRAGRRRR